MGFSFSINTADFDVGFKEELHDVMGTTSIMEDPRTSFTHLKFHLTNFFL